MKYAKLYCALFLLTLLSALLLYSAYAEVKRETINQLNKQQRILGEEAAKGIEGFFNHYARLLNALSQIDSIVTLDEHGKKLMETFYQSHAGEIATIARMDADGRNIHAIPSNPNVIGVDFSHIEFVQQMMKTHKPVVSDVFMSVRGFQSIAFHVPVFNNDVFEGSVGVMIPFDHLAKRYLEGIKLAEDGYAWMISRNGVELYCPVPGHVGKSVYENCRDFPTILSMADEMVQGKEGVTTYFYDRVRGATVRSERKHAVYLPVHLPDNHWSIVVATPESEVLGTIHGFRNRLFLIVGIMLLTSAFCSYYLGRAFMIVKEEAKRKRMAMALQKSETKYRRLVELARDGILASDAEGNTTFANPRMTELVGYTAEEMIGRRLDSFMGTSGVDVFKACMEPGNQGAKEENDFEFVRKDGLRIHTRVAACPIMAGGSCIGALAVVTDMTTQKRVEEQLRESEERWHFALEGAGDGVWDWNTQTNRVFFSRQCLAMLGFEDHEIGDTLDEWGKRVHPEDKERAHIDLKNHFDGHAPVYVNELRILCKDGDYKWILARGKVISRTDKGEPLRVIGTLTDITERKRAEDDLRASEERYRLIFNHAPLGIIHFDQMGAVQDLNDKFAEIIGAPKENHLGFNMLERVHDPAFLQAVEDAIGSGSGYYEGDYLSILGRKTTPLRTIYKRINAEDGKFLGAVGIFEDITERKLAEKELKDSEQQLRSMIQGYPIPAFVIGTEHQVVYWNKALEQMSKINANEVVGTNRHWRAFYSTARPCMADLLVDVATPEAISHWYGGISNKSSFLEEAYEATDFFPELDGNGKWLHFTAAAIRNSLGDLVGAIETIEDVTARKKAEAALRESEERFRRFADEVTSEGIIVHDEDYILDVNEKFAAMYGYERSELIGTVHFKTLAPSDRELVKSKIQQENEHPYEAVALRKDGSTFPIEIRIRTIPLRGKMVRAAAVRDLTDQKRAEDALISANRQLNDIIEFLPDATVVIDRDKKIIAWNRALEEMTGVSKKEMIGKGDYACTVPFYGERRPHLLNLIDAPDEELESRYQHVTRKGGILRAVTYVPCAHGGKGACVFCTGAPLFDAHGNRAGAIESIRDVTEQRQAQEALRHSEEKYRELVQNANSIILRMDNVGKVTFFNEFAQSFFGYSEEEILGKNVVGTIVPEVESTTIRDVRLMIEDIAVNPDRYAININENTRRSGERVWIAWTNKPILDENGRVMEVLCVGNDITERKKMEQKAAQLAAIVETSDDAIIGKDLDGIITSWNRGAEKIYGYAESEAIDKPISILLPPGLEGEAPQLLEKIKSGEHIERYETVRRRKDGRDILMSLTMSPVRNVEGRIVAAATIGRDVTERRKAEETLRDSETRLRAITDSARDAILMMDPEGMITYWNPAAERILGYTREEAGGQNLHRLIAPQRYLAAHDAAFCRFVETGQDEAVGKTLELVARRKDGKEIPVELSLSSVFMNGWQAVGLLRDITERKQAEEELRESRQQLSDIIDFLPDGTLVIDKDGKVIAWNRAIEEMTGIRAVDMLGKGNYDYALPFHGERRPILIDLVLKSRQEIEQKYAVLEWTDGAIAGEAYMPALRGGEVYLFGTASALFDSNGNVVGAIESIRDITERKHMEEAVAEAEAKYRGIFENSVMGIFQSTPEGIALSLNMAFAHMLGFDSPEEVLSTTRDIFRQLYVNPDRRSELLRLIEKRGMAQEFEVQFFRKDRSVAWISLNMRAVHDVNGKIIRMEGSAQDITESKRLASQLNQAQKMEAIGTLAGGIAHDFNNILMPIIGYSELSLNAVPKDSRLHHNIEQILVSGNRARELVKQILTFSRRTEQERRPVQVSLLVKETLKLLRASLPSTIQIRQAIDAGATHATTMADPTQIHQVLMNLCTNAAHAMREKAGVLSITLKNVDIDSVAISEVQDLAPGSYLRLSVSDTGHGMDEGVRERIFDPYFTTKGPSEGTGLGLALVYGIITSLSGGIAVFSEPGQGATFDVYFPRTKTLQAPMVDASEPLPIGKGVVLVVDDEQPIVDMLKEMLGGLGYDVAGRYSSYDALQAFRARPDSFDLVITDLTMPHMTGIDLAREILKSRPDTPIILCTGFSEAVDENRTKLLGIRGFLMKPIALRDLAETVKKTLSQDKPII